jgi:hypothetical protein
LSCVKIKGGGVAVYCREKSDKEEVEMGGEERMVKHQVIN